MQENVQEIEWSPQMLAGLASMAAGGLLLTVPFIAVTGEVSIFIGFLSIYVSVPLVVLGMTLLDHELG